jgi:hypothetical protein
METEDFKDREEEDREAAKEGDQTAVVSVPNAGTKYLIKRESLVLK